MNKSSLEIGQEYAVFHGGLFTTRCKPGEPRTYVHRVIRGRLVSKDHPVPYRGKTKKGLLFEAVEGFKLERVHNSDEQVEAGQTFGRVDGHDVICSWTRYLQEQEKYDREKAEREALNQESRERFDSVVDALKAAGVEVEEPAAHIRRFGLVTLTIDNAENLVAVMTPKMTDQTQTTVLAALALAAQRYADPSAIYDAIRELYPSMKDIDGWIAQVEEKREARRTSGN